MVLKRNRVILTKQNISSIDIDRLINDNIKFGDLNKILFVVPTKRKIRYLTRELISLSPGKSVAGLKIETIGSFAEKMLEEIDGKINSISEEASILLLSQSFRKIKLKYFSQYRNHIPFGTLERVKNVIDEYKRHGISPDRLIEESKKLMGGEKLKALDIAGVYKHYQNSLEKNNYLETGDIYSNLIVKEKQFFDEAFNFVFPGTHYIIINGFDEFALPEIEIIDSSSLIKKAELYVVLDYYKYNPMVFSHLNICHEKLVEKGFNEVRDLSLATQNKFLNNVREKLSLQTSDKIENNFKDRITLIEAQSREEEVDLLAKEIKKILQNKNVEPEDICIVFNLIGNYSTTIRDRFNVYGIPFNLTDRFSLSTSPPVKAILSLLEIVENDYYYKNIFRAFSSSFLKEMGIEITYLLKSSVELKIVSGYENWLSKINSAITELTSPEYANVKSEERIRSYRKALIDLNRINSELQNFSTKLTADEFRENLLSLIFKLKIHQILLQADSNVVENDSIALNTFIAVIDEVIDIIKLEYGSQEKFSLHFYLNQFRTTTAFTRYNIPEKPGYGVQITTLNEIRGLDFDYLFIGGLNDGDLPTRFTPEIFFSGSFSKEEIRHQTEQRYLFYQSLCTWKKKLYLSFPQTDNNRELVQSSFLKDFISLFEIKSISKSHFQDEIYSKEELLELIGKLTQEQRLKLELPNEAQIDIESIKRSIHVDEKRIAEPYSESEFSGYINNSIPEELKIKMQQWAEGEFSATQLENYAKCPYKYFVESILKLETIEEPREELEAFEYGSLIHTILFEFYTKLKQKEINLAGCAEPEFKVALELLFNIAEKKFEKLNLNSDLTFYEREKLLGVNGKRSQSLLYKFLIEERSNDSGYIPEFFELSFGNLRSETKTDRKFNEAVIADKVKLRGKIDRIDINEKAKTFKVLDYKLGGTKPTSEDLRVGISLQLPLYLFAAKELIKNELNKEFNPASAQIYSLKFSENDFGPKSVSLKSARSKTENTEEEIEAAEEMIRNCIAMINKFTKEISEGKFHLTTLQNREAKVCKFCDFKKICRIQEVD